MFTMKESFADDAEVLCKIQGKDKQTKLSLIGEHAQHGSLILEAIIVLGMVATFTPLLYKQVADRRADIENINRANTLLYLQQKTEEYLKNPSNITALVDELGHNQHKEIYPSEMGIGDNFDGRYIIGIRREDEENRPVLKAMIIDTVHTGSDLRAAKVAELIGVSAGIYTAVDPDAAWGINGLWSEPLERYFTTTNFPTGAVAVTTEYNKEKYRVSISDILVDSDLDMGEFEVTAEQINAINLAVQNGTIDQLIAQDINAQNITTTNKITSTKVVATKRFCFDKGDREDCIDGWDEAGEEAKNDLQLVQECNSGMMHACKKAYKLGLNTTCAKIDAIYDAFNDTYPIPKIYTLTYGNGEDYEGKIRVKCEGTSFEVNNISTSSLADSVAMVGGSAFSITKPGWYQITLMGEPGSAAAGDNKKGSGGVIVANKQFSKDDILTIKAIKGGRIPDTIGFGGAGVALMDSVYANTPPALVAGGGTAAGSAGGGYEGGYGSESQGYSWNGDLGNNTTYCNGSSNCNTANGGAGLSSPEGWGGSGYCKSGYTCTSIPGGNSTASPQNWSANVYGNNVAGYASIAYCGESETDCPSTCTTNANCSGSTPYCDNGFCSSTKSCLVDASCPSAIPFCDNSVCVATKSCTSDSDCPSAARYCNINVCDTVRAGTTVLSGSGSYKTVAAGKYKIILRGGVASCDYSIYRGSRGTNYYGAGGVLTATKVFSKGVTLTVKTLSGGGWWERNSNLDTYSWSGGAGIAFWAGGSAPVLAAGGGGADRVGGGGFSGGSGWRSSGANWTGASGSSGVSCNGKCTASGSGTGAGAGYCESGYSCVASNGTNGQNGASATVYYCGPTSSSPCP